MADAKITELVEKTTFIKDDDLFVIVDSEGTPTTKKIKKKTFLSTFTLTCKKATAGTINANQAVYIAGYDSVNSITLVELAKADSPTTMSAIGITAESITDSAEGAVIVFGALENLDTSSYTIGDALYVSSTVAGGLTNVKPDSGALVQKIGTVIFSDVATGVIEISGAYRSNDLPNLAEGKIWQGDANGVPQEVELAKPGWLSYYNNATQDSTTVEGTTLTKASFNTDLGSNNSNSLFTKVNATDFRTDFNGYVEISVSVSGANINTNDRSIVIELQKNGTAITGTRRYITTKNVLARANTAAIKIPVSCATNDVWSLGFGVSTEASGDTARLSANGASFSIRRIDG